MRFRENGGLTYCESSVVSSWVVDEAHCEGLLVMPDSGR